MLKRIGLVVLGVWVALGAAECMVRMLDLAPEVAVLETSRYRLSPNPHIGYEPVPDYRGDATGDAAPRNKMGFRDREHPKDKPDGVFRVAVLGDSVAAGLRVEEFEATFPAVLEAELQRAGVDAEVLSFAVNGYNTMQEVELFRERGLDFRPDLVLVAYCLNDVERSDGQLLDNLLALEAGRLAPAQRGHAFATSALYRYIRYRVIRPSVSGEAKLREKYARLHENTVLPSLTELAALGRRHDFEVMLSVFPYFADLADYDERYASLHEYLRLHSHANGIRFLDLLEPLRHCGDPPGKGVAYDTLHPNELGHRCAGEAGARFVLEGLDGGNFRRR